MGFYGHVDHVGHVGHVGQTFFFSGDSGGMSAEPQRGVEWQIKIDDARTKLKSVYPKIRM